MWSLHTVLHSVITKPMTLITYDSRGFSYSILYVAALLVMCVFQYVWIVWVLHFVYGTRNTYSTTNFYIILDSCQQDLYSSLLYDFSFSASLHIKGMYVILLSNWRLLIVTSKLCHETDILSVNAVE